MSRRPDLLLPATRDWLHQGFRRAAFAPSMDLVDALAGEGHAAVNLGGPGPSVVVLTTHRAGRRRCWSQRTVRLAAGWSGLPTSGVEVVRALSVVGLGTRLLGRAVLH
jgi:homoserine kinase